MTPEWTPLEVVLPPIGERVEVMHRTKVVACINPSGTVSSQHEAAGWWDEMIATITVEPLVDLRKVGWQFWRPAE